jgi:hypothetical protein
MSHPDVEFGDDGSVRRWWPWPVRLTVAGEDIKDPRAAPPADYVPVAEDVTILVVLEEACVALTVAQIQVNAGIWCRDEKKKGHRPTALSESAIKKRIPILLRAGLIARPEGKKTRMVAIRPAGRETLKALHK